MNEELQVLRITARRLREVGIPYVVTGSIAANYYTVPRMTRDIDVVIELKTANVERFCNTFEHDFYLDKEIIEREVQQRGMFNLIHNEYVIKVDFIILKKTEFQAAMFSRKREVLVEDSPIWFITAEDLILAKMIWAKDSLSEVQIKDVRNLMETVDDLDEKYIESWVLELGLQRVYARAKQ